MLEKWWSLEACKACKDNNGGCECDRSGNCKCLEHEAAKQADVHGNPLDFLNGELFRFTDLVRNAIYLSPLGLNGAPTLQALGWMDIETPYDTETTQTLAFMILADCVKGR
ncbi:MAG: hypothetical protein FWB90_01325 [Fibromonadales bacterium]|nr:hypothetical protein [Fibromonadales bacterium]